MRRILLHLRAPRADRGAGAYRHRRRTGRRSPRASRIRCSGPTTSWRWSRSGSSPALTGGRARWAYPAAFLAAMVLGGVLGVGARRCRGWSRRSSPRWWCWGRRPPSRCAPPLGLACAVIAVFGMAHGTAHGLEAPALGGAALRSAGSCSSTAALASGSGWRLGSAQRPAVARALGAAAGLAGVALMLA